MLRRTTALAQMNASPASGAAHAVSRMRDAWPAAAHQAYNASSVVVTGTLGTSVTYLVYYDDPTYAGGARTLGATTSYATLVNSDSRVYVGSITVNFPSTSGGTGGGGGQTPCVRIDAYIPEGEGQRRMGHVKAGELIRSFNAVCAQVTAFAHAAQQFQQR